MKTIGNLAFAECARLPQVVIPGNVETVGQYAFEVCTALARVTFQDCYAAVKSAAFRGCQSLTDVSLGTHVKSVEWDAFRGCSSLPEIMIPDSVTFIGDNAFRDCSELTKAVTGDGVTSIRESAFRNCGKLAALEIGNKVTTINSSAFLQCDHLSDIYYPGSSAEWNAIKIEQSLLQRISDGKTTVHYNSRMPNNLPKKTGGVVSFSESQYNVDVNQSLRVTATVGSNSSATSSSAFNATSNNAAVAKVGELQATQNGTGWSVTFQIQGIAPGTATITLTNTADEKSAMCNVTVKESEINDDAPITTITKTIAVISNDYGVPQYENTTAGNVLAEVTKFQAAMNDYLEVLRTVATLDSKTAESDISDDEKIAAQIMAEDEARSAKRIVTIDPKAMGKADIITVAYRGFTSVYLEQQRQEGISLSKIDAETNEIKSAIGLVKELAGNLWSINGKVARFGQYKVTVFARGFNKAFTGDITVVKGRSYYYFPIQSDMNTSAEVLTQYLEELQKISEDLYKQALKSILSELSDVTGLSDIAKTKKSALESRLKKYVTVLQEKGYGNVLAYILKIRDGYDLTLKFSAVANAGDLKKALKEAESVKKKIQEMDYSDSAVNKRLVKAAMDKISKAKGKLEKALESYITGSNNSGSSDDNEQKPWYKNIFKTILQCPVDFEVFNRTGQRIGYAINGDVSYTDEIYIEVNGDVKTLYTPSNMDVDLKLLSTDYGTMNYVVEEIKDGSPTGRLNYYDIPLKRGISYTQSLNASASLNQITSAPLKSSDNTVFNANEYLKASDMTAHVTIETLCEEGGTALGADTYPKGDCVTLIAYPLNDNYEFAGWYVDGVLAETEDVYRFTAERSVVIKANFNKRCVLNRMLTDIPGKSYAESTWTGVYDCADGSQSLAIRMLSMNLSSSLSSVTLKQYANNGSLYFDKKLNTVADASATYWIHNIDFLNCAKAELYDNNGELISLLGTIPRGDAVEIYSVNYQREAGKISAVAVVSNNTDADIRGTFVLAAYAGNGHMLQCGVVSDVILEMGSTITQEVIVDYQGVSAEKPLSMKLFIFEQSSCRPLTSAYTTSFME